jgi:hypothetical protein
MNIEEVIEDPTEGVSCVLSFIIFDDNDIQFDCTWMKEEDVVKMAALLKAIMKTDFIKNNVKEMQCTHEEGKKFLLKTLSSKPHMLPSEVYGGQNAN